MGGGGGRGLKERGGLLQNLTGHQSGKGGGGGWLNGAFMVLKGPMSRYLFIFFPVSFSYELL